jgi:phage/plasmid-associated DNA primase
MNFSDLKITPSPSKFSSYRFCETFDDELLRTLIHYDELLINVKWSMEHLFQSKKSLKTFLTDYLKKMNNKTKMPTVAVSYAYNEKYNFGRVYADKSLSIGNMPRAIRHTIAKDFYYDFDVCNAHPSVLNFICSKNELPHSNLNYYVINRKMVLKETMDFYDCDRDCAKNLFLVMTYGGGIDCWKSKWGITKEETPEFVLALKKELNSIAKTIYNKNPELRKVVDDKMKIYRKQLKEFENGTRETKPKQVNKFSSAMSTFAQDKERVMLEYMFDFFVLKKIIKKTRGGVFICVLCYDGIMVPKDNVKDDINKVCEDLERFIYEKLGMNAKFEVKPMEEDIDISGFDIITKEDEKRMLIEKEREALLNEKLEELGIDRDCDTVKIFNKEFDIKYLMDGVANDLDACKKLLNIHPYFKNCKGVLYVFDDENGLWGSDMNLIKSVISRYTHYLYILEFNVKTGNDEPSKKKSYGNTTSLMMNMISMLKSQCIDNDFIRRNETSSLKRLLFNNGYIDTTDDKFMFYDKETYGFNPNILFFGKIHYDYKKETEEDLKEMETIKQKLFYNTLGEEVGKYFIKTIARGLMGDIRMKRMLNGLGVSGSGKNTITTALQYCAGDYFGTFNAVNLCYNNSSNDEAAKLRWMLLLRHCRIIISNEIKSNGSIDGNMIKKVASGGDSIVARNHCSAEEEFIPHFLTILYAQDIPPITPCDDAVLNRVRVGKFDKTFVDGEPKNSLEMKKDVEFCESVKTPVFSLRLLNILIQAYIDFIQNGEVEPEKVLLQNSDWGGDDMDAVKLFLDEFEFTNSADNYVVSADITEWVKSQKLGMSVKKLKVELVRHFIKNNKEYDNFDVGRKYICGKRSRVWTGLKYHSVIEETKGVMI